MVTNLLLLPHDKSIVVKDITKKFRYIQLMKQLLIEFQEALLCFEKNELRCFDAQVGETLCQIRAYKMYSLSTRHSWPCLPSLNDTLSDTLTRLNTSEFNYQTLLNQSKTQRSSDTFESISLSNFFSNMECLISLPSDLIFVFLSYFLCKYQIVNLDNIPVGINFKAIAKRFELSLSYSKKLGQHYQKMLSELSCSYIFELLDELPEKAHLKQILPWLHRKSDEGRMVLPCYSVTEIIILHMIQKGTKAVFLVDIQSDYQKERIAFCFQGNPITHEFDLITPLNTKTASPCVVFNGTCQVNSEYFNHEWSYKILLTGLKNLVLYNNSAHPQYSGATLSAFKINPFQTLMAEQSDNLTALELQITQSLSHQLSAKKALAEHMGCTLTNQSLFFLKHIFCNSTQAYANYYQPAEMLIKEQNSLLSIFN
ncbi:MAG: hypothetical protein H0U70_09415 [Tatlockia sp.]|nr:hypothetical protein [Tatlockia sp.]